MNKRFHIIKMPHYRKRKIVRMSGSMTVEAAVILPLFLFLFLSLFSFMEILRIQSNLLISLRETGKEMCVYGYLYDKAGSKETENGIIPGILFSQLYVKEQVIKDIGMEELDASPIVNGHQGISFLTSSIMSNKKDLIDLRAVYYVQPDFSLLYTPKYLVCTRFLGRAWTGYDVTANSEKEDSQIYVYITETGKVYHWSLDCSSLNIKIKQIAFSVIDKARNESGEKYRKCEKCGKGSTPMSVFITTDGNRYHFEKNCSGLKRTIFTIPITQVGNRTPCKRCKTK